MITIKTEAEIEKMYVSGQMLGKVLAALRKEIHEGVTTLQLDRMAEDMIRSMGAVPSFKDYHGFPYTICASLNETVVHGFANDKPLESGQLLSIDCGLVYDGWQADSAFSVGIGEVSSEVQKLMDVTEECFWKAVEVVKPGNRLGDIGNAVQTHAEGHVRPRNWPRNARRSQRTQLRQGRPRHTPSGRHDDSHRTHDSHGRLARHARQQRLGIQNRGSQRLLTLRAHDSDIG